LRLSLFQKLTGNKAQRGPWTKADAKPDSFVFSSAHTTEKLNKEAGESVDLQTFAFSYVCILITLRGAQVFSSYFQRQPLRESFA
jgi:hypothetical protein